MKIALDEHIPTTVLDAVRKLLEDERNGHIIVVGARDYVEAPSKSDVPWLRKFAEDGGSVVITGDKNMRSRPHERQALLDLNLIVFFVPRQWNNMKFMKRASYLLLWWSTIVEIAESEKRASCWELPSNWSASIEYVRNVTGPR